jgi:hypothetical protein
MVMTPGMVRPLPGVVPQGGGGIMGSMQPRGGATMPGLANVVPRAGGIGGGILGGSGSMMGGFAPVGAAPARATGGMGLPQPATRTPAQAAFQMGIPHYENRR